MRALLAAAAPLLLAGCGAASGSAGGSAGRATGDDPANAPRWGLWEMERLPTRIVKNGTELPMGESTGPDDERFTDVYGTLGLGMPDGKELCGEPRADDAGWIGRQLSGQLDRLCKVTNVERDGDRVSGEGVCGEGERGLDAETSFAFAGTDGPDALELKTTTEFLRRLDTGETHVIELGVKITARRLGECVAGRGGLNGFAE